MEVILNAAVFGLLGGLIRALVGLLKNRRIKNKLKFKPVYFLITIAIAGIIGAVTSVALSTNYTLNLVAGYAGIDLLENLVRLITKKD